MSGNCANIATGNTGNKNAQKLEKGKEKKPGKDHKSPVHLNATFAMLRDIIARKQL